MKTRTKGESAVMPNKPATPTETHDKATSDRAGVGSLPPWILAGFLVAYIPFLINAIGINLKQILDFGWRWIVENKKGARPVLKPA